MLSLDKLGLPPRHTSFSWTCRYCIYFKTGACSPVTVFQPLTMNSGNKASYNNKTYASVFARQPPRILIVDVTPPLWLDTCTNLCEALENFFSLACSLAGPCRVPLLSLYVVHNQQECLLPFVVSKNQT